jgi:hypothetical protein
MVRPTASPAVAVDLQPLLYGRRAKPHCAGWPAAGGDQRRSATAAASGHVLARALLASANSPHIAASPPTTSAFCASVPCRFENVRQCTAIAVAWVSNGGRMINRVAGANVGNGPSESIAPSQQTGVHLEGEWLDCVVPLPVLLTVFSQVQIPGTGQEAAMTLRGPPSWM